MRTAYLTTLHKLAGDDDRVVSLVADNGLTGHLNLYAMMFAFRTRL